MSEDKECFIIMPITTPELMIEKYRDGEEHFKHVLECLFIPAIEKAGYIPKPPIAKGSDLIQAEIIKNLESADIILCDMSCLNPNVFFEFGIRTSLNKPVCIVKDDLTKSVPFDTSILNHKEYNSTLDPWHLENEINIISDHLTESLERSKGENTLWKYFGLKSEAEPYKVAEGSDSKLDYLAMQMDSLREKVDTLIIPSAPSAIPKRLLSNKLREKIAFLEIIKQDMETLVSDDKEKEYHEKMIEFESVFHKEYQLLLGIPLPSKLKNRIRIINDEIQELMTNYFN